MHFIVADNLYLAKEKFNKYLKQCEAKNVENIIFDTHGGGSALIYIDNIDGTFELGKNFIGNEHLLNYKKIKGKIKQNILSLKIMIEGVKDYGNVILLGCTVCKGEEGRVFSRAIHKLNYRTNTFVSEAFNTGSVDENSGERPWYVYSGYFQPTIDWDKGASILNSQGTGFEFHQNQKGEGFKLFTAFKGEFVNIENKTPSEFGNLFIDGEYARFKY
ncbi:MAG: hypothetical protein ACOYLG_11450 [Chitinophagaceae bacterium]|jgi:hypothetical protein